MTCMINTKSKRRLPARFATGLVLLATVSIGTFAGSASADESWGHRGYDHGYYFVQTVIGDHLDHHFAGLTRA